MSIISQQQNYRYGYRDMHHYFADRQSSLICNLQSTVLNNRITYIYMKTIYMSNAMSYYFINLNG